MSPSGAQWCVRYPGSSSTADLVEPFRTRGRNFITTLQSAGAKVSVSATWRPEERAYLMHWAWAIARGLPPEMCRPGIDKPGVPVPPSSVPPHAGIEIDWTHAGDLAGSRGAAEDMVLRYGLRYCAALASNHTRKCAIDMTVSWKGEINVKDARGVIHACKKQEDLWPIGASFGVLKLPTDTPHWSENGH